MNLRKTIAALGVSLLLGAPLTAQQPALDLDDRPLFRVDVGIVVLNVAVTDRRGNYITDLKPSDFRVYEDEVEQNVASFAEGNTQLLTVRDDGTLTPSEDPENTEPTKPGPAPLDGQSFAGTNVFVLFDTSNFMYKSFVYAEDAIADFIRGLDQADSVALYGFSRNLTRHAGLTPDRWDALRGLRRSVAGDETALYNALLLTLRDAAEVPGRKVVIVFSNGPDTASSIAPDDVSAIAEDEGIPIYVISTRDLNRDAISSQVFRRISTRTGGKAFFAKSWQRQSEAFAEIKEELGSSYTLTYYPTPNPNQGWRSIRVELTNPEYRRARIRTRAGYRPKL